MLAKKCALQTDVIFANASRGGYVRRSHLVLDLSGMGELGGEPLLWRLLYNTDSYRRPTVSNFNIVCLQSDICPLSKVGVLFKVIWKPLLCRHPFLRHRSAISAKRKRQNSKDSSFERSKEPGYCVEKCSFADRICAWAQRDRIVCPKMLEIWTQIWCKS